MTIKKAESASSDKKPKKEIKKNPTPRQQKALNLIQEKMSEKGGKINKGEILKDAGYSPSVQATPDKVFATASMRRAIKSVGLDPKSLKIKHRQLINAGRVECVNANMAIPAEEFVKMFLDAMQGSRFLNWWDNPMQRQRMYYFIIPDTYTQSKVLDMAYKINGEYAPEKHEHTGKDGKELIPVVYLPDNNRTTGEKVE